MENPQKGYWRAGKEIYIKCPSYKEMEFVANLWRDEKTMEGIGGVFDFHHSKWDSFYKKMVSPTDGKNLYCLVYLKSGEPIGEVSFHGYDSLTKVARFNIKILNSFRRQGYGTEATRLLLEYFFLDFGGEMVVDNTVDHKGIALAKKMNFNIQRQKNGEALVRILKDEFLERKSIKATNVHFELEDGGSALEYSLALRTLLLANEIEGRELFNIGTSSGKELSTVEGIKIVGNKGQVMEEEDIDILFTFNGNNISTNKYKFICSKKEMNDNFIDKGREMYFSNLKGEIDMLLSLIMKIYGKTLAEKIGKKLGIFNPL